MRQPRVKRLPWALGCPSGPRLASGGSQSSAPPLGPPQQAGPAHGRCWLASSREQRTPKRPPGPSGAHVGRQAAGERASTVVFSAATQQVREGRTTSGHTHHHATPRVRAPGPQPSPSWAPYRTPALSPRDPGPWWPASPPVRPQPRHQGLGALPGPRLPPWRADGWKAPEAGSQRFAQGLTSATSSSCLGPAPAQACETRPAAPQTRMPPTAPTRHRAQRRLAAARTRETGMACPPPCQAGRQQAGRRHLPAHIHCPPPNHPPEAAK